MSDSVVEGHGLPERNTISRRLQGPYTDQPTEVLNYGVSAYCTLAEIELLVTKGIRFDPDVVVLVFVENDVDNAAAIEHCRAAAAADPKHPRAEQNLRNLLKTTGE